MENSNDKVSKRFDELDELQKLKVAKVLKYKGKEFYAQVKESTTVFENGRIRYIFVGEEIIDVN